MDWSLRELRCFVTAAEAGSLTAAAAELHVSQAAVSRRIAALEGSLGRQLLRRGRHGCEATAAGEQLLPQARRVLAEASRLETLAREQQSQIRVGYAWAALGGHTTELIRGWPESHPDVELRLLRHNSPTSGLAEGRCDAAILRVAPDASRFDSVVVGLERRLAAFPADDPDWGRRRTLRLREFAGRTVLTDPRTGTTSQILWHGEHAPARFVDSSDVEEWLTAIAAGLGVGTTSEATAVHHPRPGVVFRPIVDAPRIPVRIAWWRDDPPGAVGELIAFVARLYGAR
ncbi:LysR family transcriptional regulator [Leucobacter weissii]|uniref:LysR family transcriptional regulator n=1 Tax=Leucobacter weissii TaxID=1983706 RepID=A0A939MME4_9MICO|nr:LysR family transcriptional regulator [Leucobacter weissii]MBO1901282.1 LysR family transcriptional regulator [Leucobacter weissii]